MIKLGTHNKRFHLDEVLSTIMLKRIYPNNIVIRTRDITILNTCDIVYDVGYVFDPSKNRFDHHQSTFNETFSPQHNYKLSSAGLIFKYFSEELLATYGYKKNKNYDFIRNKIYEEYILGVDAHDNGYETNTNYRLRDLASVVHQFNRYENEDLEFNEAVEYIKIDFNNYMESLLKAWLKEYEFAEDAVLRCDSDIIVSTVYISPMSVKIHADKQGKVINFLIRQEDTGFRIYGIPVEANSFKCKIYLKKEWRGLSGDQLREVCSIKTSNFVHASGFTGGAVFLEDAIEMCRKSIEV
jgi:uncharacterized UPF0160 family protein